MSEQSVARHGLEAFIYRQPDKATDGDNARFSVDIVSGLGYLNLRGNPQDKSFVDSVEKVMRQALPIKAHTMSVEDHACYWLGPDEWLLATSRVTASELCEALQDALSSSGGTVSNVSGGYAKFNVSGSDWRGLLAQGCTLDLEELRARKGFCVQCGLAKATVLLAGSTGKSNIEIVVRRSFAEYVALWLQKSAGDAGVRFGTSF